MPGFCFAGQIRTPCVCNSAAKVRLNMKLRLWKHHEGKDCGPCHLSHLHVSKVLVAGERAPNRAPQIIEEALFSEEREKGKDTDKNPRS